MTKSDSAAQRTRRPKSKRLARSPAKPQRQTYPKSMRAMLLMSDYLTFMHYRPKLTDLVYAHLAVDLILTNTCQECLELVLSRLSESERKRLNKDIKEYLSNGTEPVWFTHDDAALEVLGEDMDWIRNLGDANARGALWVWLRDLCIISTKKLRQHAAASNAAVITALARNGLCKMTTAVHVIKEALAKSKGKAGISTDDCDQALEMLEFAYQASLPATKGKVIDLPADTKIYERYSIASPLESSLEWCKERAATILTRINETAPRRAVELSKVLVSPSPAS